VKEEVKGGVLVDDVLWWHGIPAFTPSRAHITHVDIIIIRDVYCKIVSMCLPERRDGRLRSQGSSRARMIYSSYQRSRLEMCVCIFEDLDSTLNWK
jgi:hypothetical protein